MQQQVIWQAKDTVTFDVEGEQPKPVSVTAKPVVSYSYGTTVGLFYRHVWDFGYWYSSNVCDLITAWRVAQILPRIKTMRNSSQGCDSTLCGLVIAMNGDRHEDRMHERAKDLGMTVDELDAELTRLRSTWPDAATLHAMWKRSPEAEQNWIAASVRQAITEGLVDHNSGLESCVEQAEIRMRSAADQRRHEEDLITRGLENNPWESLQMLMVDLGVTNLRYSVGCGDMFEPTHFEMQNLDREIMGELIGERGFCNKVPLFTTTKGPDDMSAYHVSGGSSIAVISLDLGETDHPKVVLGDKVFDLTYVSYDRVTERFQVALRPTGVNHSDEDRLMSIEDLRGEIGQHHGCNGESPLEPGTKAPWITTSTLVSDTSAAQLSVQGWAWLAKLLNGDWQRVK